MGPGVTCAAVKRSRGFWTLIIHGLQQLRGGQEWGGRWEGESVMREEKRGGEKRRVKDSRRRGMERGSRSRRDR